MNSNDFSLLFRPESSLKACLDGLCQAVDIGTGGAVVGDKACGAAVITAGDIVELINEEEEEIKEKEVEEKKSFNYLGIIAFALVLLVALNRIFNVVPSVTYVEVGMVILAIVLEVYNYLTLKKA